MNNLNNSVCCFIGHREIEITQELILKLEILIGELIDKGVTTFLFGSKSQFDDLCHKIVTEYQLKNKRIKRVAYALKNEIAFSRKDKEEYNNLVKEIVNEDAYLKDYEEVASKDRWENSGRAGYVLRNRAMIDDSTYCAFYFQDGYSVKEIDRGILLPAKKRNSGTAQAYSYAKAKNKTLFNICEKNKD